MSRQLMLFGHHDRDNTDGNAPFIHYLKEYFKVDDNYENPIITLIELSDKLNQFMENIASMNASRFSSNEFHSAMEKDDIERFATFYTTANTIGVGVFNPKELIDKESAKRDIELLFFMTLYALSGSKDVESVLSRDLGFIIVDKEDVDGFA